MISILAATLFVSACGGGDDEFVAGEASLHRTEFRTDVGWSKIADEWKSFSTSGSQIVRFGAGSAWKQKIVSGAGQCTNTFFGGDPVVNVFKSCEVQVAISSPAVAPPAPTSATWIKVADEYAFFSISGTKIVRYGSGSQWVEKSVSGNAYCNNAYFGRDPIVNVQKRCEVKSEAATSPSGSLPSVPAPVSSGRIKIAQGQLIEYYGDSTVFGNLTFVGTQVPRPAPKVFAEALGNKYVVSNEGTSGKTSGDLLYGTDGKHLSWDLQMTYSKATVVIINHALNDKARSNVTTYAANLRALASIAKSKGKQVVFETPNPDAWGGLVPFNDAMKTVAREAGIPVIDQYGYLTSYLGGADVRTLVPDGTHPSEFGYELKGKYAAKVFGEFLIQ